MNENIKTRLAAAMSFNAKVTIYVPATLSINKTIDNTPYVNAAAEMLSNLFGGATATNVSGYYVSDELNALVREDTTTVYSCCEQSALDANLETIISFCDKLKVELEQECIGLELNNTMYYI